MSEPILLEEQSKENLAKICYSYNISIKEAANLTTLSLDATLFEGHIDLKEFRSVENLYIFKPFNVESRIFYGITSLDLSSNKDIKELYFAPKTVPNFNMITLAHSNQVKNLYYNGNLNVLDAFTDGKKEVFCRNMINKINIEPNKDKKAFLKIILDNHLHILKFNHKEDINYQEFLMSQFLKRFGQNVLA